MPSRCSAFLRYMDTSEQIVTDSPRSTRNRNGVTWWVLNKRKLKRKGVTLTERQLSRFVTQLKNGVSTIRWSPNVASNVSLVFTELESSRIEQQLDGWFQRALKKLPQVYGNATKQTAETF